MQYKNLNNHSLFQIRPLGTIVHRCEEAGCCTNYNERCQPNKIEEVTLKFAVLQRRKTDFTVTIRNHTECSCQQMLKENQIKKK